MSRGLRRTSMQETATSVPSPTILLRDYNIHTVAGTSTSISKPTGTVSGDFMLVGWLGQTTTAPTVPSGWTLVHSPNAVSQGVAVLYIYKKIAGGSEPSSYTFTNSSVTDGNIGIVSLRGGATAITDFQTKTSSTATTAWKAPATLTTVTGNMVVRWMVGTTNHQTNTFASSSLMDESDANLTYLSFATLSATGPMPQESVTASFSTTYCSASVGVG